jgi:hypothetical protein
MPTYVVYSTTTNAVAWLSVQPSVPIPPTGMAYLAVPDGTALGNSRWDVIAGALVAHAPTLPESQAAKTAAAVAQYRARIAAGFTSSGTLYQIGPASQTQIAAMGALALGSITDPANSPWPAGFTWIAADNSQVAMDAPTLYAFARAVAAYVSGCILNLRSLKNAIAATTTQDQLTAIDVTAGYPAASA